MPKQSEYGKGLVYCLGLFLAHADRIRAEKEVYKSIGHEEGAYEMWFYAAADHLFEFEVDSAPKHLKARCLKFRHRVLALRLPISGPAATEKDYVWAVQEAKDLLRLIDKAHGVMTIKGTWE